AVNDLVQSNLHKSGIRREVVSILGDLVLCLQPHLHPAKQCSGVWRGQLIAGEETMLPITETGLVTRHPFVQSNPNDIDKVRTSGTTDNGAPEWQCASQL